MSFCTELLGELKMHPRPPLFWLYVCVRREEITNFGKFK